MDTLLFYAIGGATFLFSMAVRQKLLATYATYRRVPNQVGLAGAQVARAMLDRNQLQKVRVLAVPGKLSDHYDPRKLEIRLSDENARSTSVAAMAVSAHEVGHALQDADDYGPLELRSALFPLAAAASRFGIPLAIFGFFAGSELLVAAGMLGYLELKASWERTRSRFGSSRSSYAAPRAEAQDLSSRNAHPGPGRRVPAAVRSGPPSTAFDGAVFHGTIQL